MEKSGKKLKFIITQILIALLITTICLSLSFGVFRQIEKGKILELRKDVSERSQQIQTDLLYELNSSLYLVLGLVGYININPEPDNSEYEQLANVIIRESGTIRNIGLAPGNVISYIYPLKGNEAALGLDYMKTPAQKDAVLRAIRTKKTVIAGPVNLVQGGEGFIARIPIFTGDNADNYWGISSIVVDKNRLLNGININSEGDWLEVAIIGKDGLGLDGEVFSGDAAILDKNPIMTTIQLPEGHWVLAAVPVDGWQVKRKLKDFIIVFFGIFISLIVSTLALILSAATRKMHIYALQDPLTKLSNRRMFQILSERQIVFSQRSKKRFYLIYFDLDNFKAVNDTLGHKTGDVVLETVSKRISNIIRKNDVFARMGGDEFILLPCHLTEVKNLEVLCGKIINEISKLNLELNNNINLGCSLGISCYPEDGTDITELIKKADNAMYKSKNSGKNRLSFYSRNE